jgi:feruloyl esterase
MKIPKAVCLLTGFLASFLVAAPALAATGCPDLGKGTTIGDATVLSSQEVSGGRFDAGAEKFEKLPSFCRVVARAQPSPQSNIVIEIWLPVGDAWNGKILGTGNGGFAGNIRFAALAGGLRRGYAVANTDMGTYPAATANLGYEAGNGRPEAVKDWGYRATHEMALLTRKMVERFYGRAARHAYFAGCSTGGHQGLTEAQRYPDDYDAIIAGAPGNNRTHLHAMFTWLALTFRAPGAAMGPQAFSLWTSALQKACAGRDGGAPGDGYFTDPTQCTLQPGALRCKPGNAAGTCLTEGQITALDRLYGGTRNPRTGGLIYPPEMRGIEGLLALWFANPAASARPVPSDLSRWVFGPEWDAASFDFDKDMAREDDALGRDVNALDPDLSRFVARGGKLILFHGWADPVVSPVDTVSYFDRLYATGAKKPSFARLFMVPGMSHCSGGPGADMFGQGAEYPVRPDDADMLTLLDRWVERGVAPDTVVAVKLQNADPMTGIAAPDAPIAASRPLCAYPNVPRYKGGDRTLAASFRCEAAPPARYERPAPEYLK